MFENFLEASVCLETSVYVCILQYMYETLEMFENFRIYLTWNVSICLYSSVYVWKF